MYYNFKRGFHRVFVVFAILWVLLCAVYPIWERDQHVKFSGAQHAQMRLNCDSCPEYATGTACTKITWDCQKGVDELEERMFRENPWEYCSSN
jgi:hypothetical protein